MICALILLGSFTLSAPLFSHERNIEFETLSLERGLSQSSVMSIVQDEMGFLWFATEDGLNKYDGYAFTVLRHDPDNPNTLSHTWILSLLKDRSGMLWIGTFSVPKRANSINDGAMPIIITPEEGDWLARNQAVTYCWELPDTVSELDVAGYELQFSNTETPGGPWDPVRFFTHKCWHYHAGHQGTYDALYWHVRIVFEDGSRGAWAVSYHRVG